MSAKRKPVSILCLIILACTVLGLTQVTRAEPWLAKCHDDACFFVQERVEDVLLPLRGLSTFRYWGLRVYTGALYISASATRQAARTGETPKKLILRYHRSVSVDQFVEKVEETLTQNPQLSLERLQPFLAQMNSFYVPVQEGDTYAISYTPSQGTLRLFFNDRLLGQIADRYFAHAYFGIWLSDYSVSSKFTNEILSSKN